MTRRLQGAVWISRLQYTIGIRFFIRFGNKAIFHSILRQQGHSLFDSPAFATHYSILRQDSPSNQRYLMEKWNGRRSSHIREGGSVMVLSQLWISSANQASLIRLSALGDIYFRELLTILPSFFIAIISFTLGIKYISSYILVYNTYR